MKRRITISVLLLVLGATVLGGMQLAKQRLGWQSDGTFVVSSGQRIEAGTIAFDGRPIDIALHPTGEFFAVLNQRNVFLADKSGIIEVSLL